MPLGPRASALAAVAALASLSACGSSHEAAGGSDSCAAPRLAAHAKVNQMSLAQLKKPVAVHPGQKLHLWGWAYVDSCKEQATDKTPQPLAPVTLTLIDHAGHKQSLGTASPSGSEGTFSATVTIPQNAALGDAHITDDNAVYPGRLPLSVMQSN